MRRLGILCLLPALAIAAEPTSKDWYQAIRENNLTAMKSMASSKAAVNVTDSRGTTPLMQAASVGSLEAMKVLLEAGAAVNAKNGLDITALIYGAPDLAKVKLLVAAGADVNAKSKLGRTALIAAASTAGATGTVRLLLSKGADTMVKDNTHSTPLTEAARMNDLESLRLLLAHPGEVNEGDRLGFTPLLYAASRANAEAVKLLLAKGADPNVSYTRETLVRNGPIALTKLTPLMMAPSSSPEVMQILLAAGANVNARDGRGMTPLIFAAATDTPNPATLRLLLKAGADPEIESNVHERARDWAAKFNHPEVMKLLGAKRSEETKNAILPVAAKQADVREGLTRSVALLQATSTEYFKQSGCLGCHHQPLIGLAVDHALKGSVPVNAAARKEQTQIVRTENLTNKDLILQGFFISVDSLASFMLYFAEAGYPADDVTDTLVSALASQQQADGSWAGVPVVRPPLEDSTWVRSAFAAMAMAKYPIPARRAEFAERVARARRWLAESKPETAYEHSFQLLGLLWTGAGANEVNRTAAAVRKLQRADGGWGQSDTLPGDAFATSVALYALQQAGLSAQDGVTRRAVDYLMRTQQPDGSWHVASRATKLQPYFQSGFPYDHDQWISAAATGWAVAALSDTLTPASSAAAR